MEEGVHENHSAEQKSRLAKPCAAPGGLVPQAPSQREATLDPCQKVCDIFVLTKTTSHKPNMPMDILDRIKFQGPFGMDQMSYGYLDRPNVLQGH